MTRTSTDSVLFSTYNMLDLFADGSAAGREHYHLAVASARALDADVLAVQEVRAHDQKTAQARLRELADDLGLSCTVPASGGGPARTALAVGGRGYHVGLLWRPGIEPVPGSLRVYGAGEFWHSLSYVTLDVGGTKVRHASFHATPFVRQVRADQNESPAQFAIGGGFGIMGNHQYRLAQIPVRLPQHIENDAGAFRIQVAGGFVGEHDGGTVDESPRECNSLLLAAGKLVRPMR